MITHTFPFQPVIIIGAGRSGTNMLRNALTRVAGVTTWPCDEINYIWRYGNARRPHDELLPNHISTETRRYIRRAFRRQASRTSAAWLVEKTCANSLRVEFVDAIIPEAKFLFIVREGRDVVASALKRWTAGLELTYLLKKAVYVPPADIVYYASRYLSSHLQRLQSHEKRLASWGPRFDGLDELLKTSTLPEVCAHQWRESVNQAAKGLAQLPAERVHFVRYEDFVLKPVYRLQEVLEFLAVPAALDTCRDCVTGISSRSVGKWQRELDEVTCQRIAPIINSCNAHWPPVPATRPQRSQSA